MAGAGSALRPYPPPASSTSANSPSSSPSAATPPCRTTSAGGAPTPISQDAQHHQLLVTGHWAQPDHAGGDQRERVRIGGGGLAALAGSEHPRMAV
jgi:hypothetical protein